MSTQTLTDLASILADVGPIVVAIVVPWLAFRWALLREQRQWSREQRAQVYVDLLVWRRQPNMTGCGTSSPSRTPLTTMYPPSRTTG